MPTQEIKETNWQKFCERFEEAHRGLLITLEVVDHTGTTKLIANDEPLRSFRFRKDSCNDVIELELGESPGPITQHQIVEPIHMRLREREESRKELEIDAESGSVEMRFTSGRIGAILNEMDLLSPQELGREGGRIVHH
jgi:hypothetical protein